MPSTAEYQQAMTNAFGWGSWADVASEATNYTLILLPEFVTAPSGIVLPTDITGRCGTTKRSAKSPRAAAESYFAINGTCNGRTLLVTDGGYTWAFTHAKKTTTTTVKA